MYLGKKIICIIPARSGSSGLKNKNIKIINGKPLLYWPIKAAKKSKIIDEIVVTTDSKKIQKKAINLGANAPFLRPKKISQNSSKISDAIVHVINFYKKRVNKKFDYLILLEPTSPLTETKDIDKTLKILIKNNNLDSLVTVTQNITSHPSFNFKIKNKKLKKISNDSPDKNRQNISKMYYLSGNLYISKTDFYLKKRSFIGLNTYGFILDKWKASEIDDMVDFLKTQIIMRYKKI